MGFSGYVKRLVANGIGGIPVLEMRLADIDRMRRLSKQRDERKVERLNMFDRNRGSRKWKASVLMIAVTLILIVHVPEIEAGPCRWPRGLRRASSSDGKLGLWVRIPRRESGCLSVVNVMVQVEASAMGRSFFQGEFCV